MMSLPNELLELARHLANLENETHAQANIRRSVSTAYYALFHLMVSETTLNWSQIETRSALGRLFEHKKMKGACERKVAELNKLFSQKELDSPEFAVSKHLRLIAKAFVQAHQERNDADYETSEVWNRADALAQVDLVSRAFESWEAIKQEPVAQAFLFSLLAKDR
jgi:hypothetical protein